MMGGGFQACLTLTSRYRKSNNSIATTSNDNNAAVLIKQGNNRVLFKIVLCYNAYVTFYTSYYQGRPSSQERFSLRRLNRYIVKNPTANAPTIQMVFFKFLL